MKNKKVIKLIIIILIIIFVIFFSTNLILKQFIYKTKYLEIIKENTSKYYVDPYLVLSIIKAESDFNKDAISNKGAYGLMQLLYSTANEVNDNINIVGSLTKSDLFDEKINITLGTKYISTLIKYYNGNYYIALCAYNAGCGNVNKWIEQGIINKDFNYNDIDNIPYNETKNYLLNVIKNYKMYKFLY